MLTPPPPNTKDHSLILKRSKITVQDLDKSNITKERKSLVSELDEDLDRVSSETK